MLAGTSLLAVARKGRAYDLNYTFVDGLLAWNTRRISEVPVRHEPRQAGRSGYSLRKLLVLALNLFTNFSLLPLQIVSLCGFLAAGLGFVMGGYYLVLHFRNRQDPRSHPPRGRIARRVAGSDRRGELDGGGGSEGVMD